MKYLALIVIPYPHPFRPHKWIGKILKQVEYESAPRKKHVNEKTRYREEQVATLLFLHLFL